VSAWPVINGIHCWKLNKSDFVSVQDVYQTTHGLCASMIRSPAERHSYIGKGLASRYKDSYSSENVQLQGQTEPAGSRRSRRSLPAQAEAFMPAS